ncbi:GNAT family N-acetyltransferase [Listeria monocytogenes]|uniref:GNAT family N-acetyltransferase n=1 Tax=Listeria TaxID=1637 RepID=UPI00190628E3|nr:MULTISPECIES: GNAT family N-acetyltransferase [Listeria]MBK1965082.1 GNAT family N-acetyltransferase [Listeria ivanovii subsp. londoniensis]WDE53503.1 GNAT family N-acetyltransferase [Listeria monocytogenes]HEM1440018.1 GNAT family N-acetyltransferase [Listeria monocytogenes]
MGLNIEIKSISGLTDIERQAVMDFTCGNTDIDLYLQEDALSDYVCNLTRTFILFLDDKVAGYFTLTSDRALITRKSTVSRKLPSHPHFTFHRDSIPALQIHHFAIAKTLQKQGTGVVLMNYLITFIKLKILPNVGATLLTVYSLKEAVGFYSKIGFEKTGCNSNVNVNMALVLSEVLDDFN